MSRYAVLQKFYMKICVLLYRTTEFSRPICVDMHGTKGWLCIPCFKFEAATKLKSAGKLFLE